eukprot:476017_1
MSTHTTTWWNVFYDLWYRISAFQPRGKHVNKQCVNGVDQCLDLSQVSFMLRLYDVWNTHQELRRKYDTDDIESLMTNVITMIKNRDGIPIIYFVLRILHNIIQFPRNNKIRKLDVNQIRKRTNPYGQATINILLGCGFELLTHNNKQFLLLRPDSASKDIKKITIYGDMMNAELWNIPLLDLVQGLKDFAIEDLINKYDHITLNHCNTAEQKLEVFNYFVAANGNCDPDNCCVLKRFYKNASSDNSSIKQSSHSHTVFRELLDEMHVYLCHAKDHHSSGGLMKQFIDKYDCDNNKEQHFHHGMCETIGKVLKKTVSSVNEITLQCTDTETSVEEHSDHTKQINQDSDVDRDQVSSIALDYRWKMVKTELTKNWNDEIMVFLQKEMVEEEYDFELLMDDIDEFSIHENNSELMAQLIFKYDWNNKTAQMFQRDMCKAIEKVLNTKDYHVLSETEEETETETDIEKEFDRAHRINQDLDATSNVPDAVSKKVLLQYQLALADHQGEIHRLQQRIQDEIEKRENVEFECREQLMFECPNFNQQDSDDEEPTVNDQHYAEYIKHSYFDETDCEDNTASDVDDDDTVCEEVHDDTYNNDVESKLSINDEIHIFVQQLGGDKTKLIVKSSDNIQTVKDLIHDKLNHSQEEFRLIFQGENLENERKLTSYAICNNSIIYLVFRLRGGCFVGSTKVLLTGAVSDDEKNVDTHDFREMREIDIQDVCVGDKIISYNLKQNKIELCLVKSVIQYSVNELVEITFSDGTKIICTASHPFYVESKKRYCCVESINSESQYGSLNVGDKVINYRLKLLNVENIEYKYINNGKNVPVYTLHIGKIDNLYANGILVHIYNHMQIFVKTLDHLDAQTYVLDVEPNDTIKSIKHKIE